MSDVQDLKRHFVRGAFRGLVASVEDLTGAWQRDAPIEEGTLRASAAIAYVINGTRYENAGAAEAAAVAAAGHGDVEMYAETSANTPYAAAQEAAVATMHRGGKTWEWVARNHPRGGKAHYMGDALAAGAERYPRVIAASAEQALRRE
jgi:hypothetical protein